MSGSGKAGSKKYEWKQGPTVWQKTLYIGNRKTDLHLCGSVSSSKLWRLYQGMKPITQEVSMETAHNEALRILRQRDKEAQE